MPTANDLQLLAGSKQTALDVVSKRLRPMAVTEGERLMIQLLLEHGLRSDGQHTVMISAEHVEALVMRSAALPLYADAISILQGWGFVCAPLMEPGGFARWGLQR